MTEIHKRFADHIADTMAGGWEIVDTRRYVDRHIQRQQLIEQGRHCGRIGDKRRHDDMPYATTAAYLSHAFSLRTHALAIRLTDFSVGY